MVRTAMSIRPPHRNSFLPLLLAFALLFAQHVGAAHTLAHALDQSHQLTCDQCENYAQTGNALGSSVPAIVASPVTGEAITPRFISFTSAKPATATARGPPRQFQNFA
jgi:hypothetical protein